ncbi:hypothetical protein UA08_05411 [Talaromyces atroroseus]|uniref:AB hydrolase-1 domain-containing protein n=1 Tax=Talaromyces atroroseus TaxID=1441469 RepID=A0A225ADM8_TALAT|nr:hypothetical protein UA08_05411 [Talaromyces atroroseus]OKL59281.1 hypothetical protein UA08_05411 [Talaromyces atroroseus]
MPSVEAVNQSDDGLHRHTSPDALDSQSKLPHSVTHGMRSASNSWFPMGMREGWSQWWRKAPAAAAEHKVLSCIPYLREAPTQRQTGNAASAPNSPTATDSLQTADPTQSGDEAINSNDDPYGPRRWRSRMVELSGKNRALNEFSVERLNETVDQNLVILHGYGAGLGFFYKNFEPLSRAKGWQLYALDMLGMGRSTRPPFKIKATDRQEAITEAENWFIDALEEWRVKRKIDRFTLMGHSMGGYLATAYALKYPGRLNKLILVSPVGVPENPYAVNEAMPAPSESTTGGNDNGSSLNGRQPDSAGPPRPRLGRFITYLWDANVSPFSFIRWSGPLGPRLVSGWTSRRFAHLPADEAAALHDYTYSIFRLRGSGEYALTYLLAPGAFARSPLINRIQGLGRQVIRPNSPAAMPHSSSNSTPGIPTPSAGLPNEARSQNENGMPVVFMYGDHDWMDVAGGFAAKEKLDEAKRQALKNATAEQRQADNGSAKVIIIKNAGHHLYLEGDKEFNKIVLEEMEDVRRREAKRQS